MMERSEKRKKRLWRKRRIRSEIEHHRLHHLALYLVQTPEVLVFSSLDCEVEADPLSASWDEKKKQCECLVTPKQSVGTGIELPELHHQNHQGSPALRHSRLPQKDPRQE